MNKTELIRAIHERTEKKYALKDLDVLVDKMLQIMSERLREGEEIQLDDFGTFGLSSAVMKSAVKIHNKKK